MELLHALDLGQVAVVPQRRFEVVGARRPCDHQGREDEHEPHGSGSHVLGPGGEGPAVQSSLDVDAPGLDRRAGRSVSVIGRIGVLTAGGDAPGLNAAIRAVVRAAAASHGFEVFGFRNGWRGVMTGAARRLTTSSVHGIVHRGGTILGSSGADPYHEHGVDRVRRTVDDLRLDAIVAIGGEGTMGAAAQLANDGLRIVGVPKTIDNDLSGTDACIGFATAVQVATDAIDRLHTTAESHDRLMLVEVMGRSAGWIAIYAGLAGGADTILIPERPFDLEEVAARLQRRHDGGHSFSIVVVAEGAVEALPTGERPELPRDERGHPRYGGIAHAIAPKIEALTGWDTRVTVLGHVQRGGSPVAADRILASRLGDAAVDLVAAGEFGQMVALQGDRIGTVPLTEVSKVRPVPAELAAVAELFFEDPPLPDDREPA
jgi:ATP-dependent phosphofructokinase / diphosphate-dependent phosphofructokinase